MYEEYTDKQIVEMLESKLENLGYGGIAKYSEDYPALCRLCATLYKSSYIRGQLGRSFIIGERKIKSTKRWIPATEDNVKIGSKVRYFNAEKHGINPEFYPAPGTVGEVKGFCDGGACLIRWPGFYTAWFVSQFDLEVLVCE